MHRLGFQDRPSILEGSEAMFQLFHISACEKPRCIKMSSKYVPPDRPCRLLNQTFQSSRSLTEALHLNSKSQCFLGLEWSLTGDSYEDILEKQGFLLAEITDKQMPINRVIRHRIFAVFISCVRPPRYSGGCQWLPECSRRDISLIRLKSIEKDAALSTHIASCILG